MEYLAAEDFSENQIRILEYRMDGETYESIQNLMNVHTGYNTTPKHISTCLLRSSIGLPWDYAEIKGNSPYLCTADLQELKNIVNTAAELGSALDTWEVLDESARLKGQRVLYAMEFLDQINCPELKKKLAEQDIYTPSRTWINGIIDDLGAKIKNRRFIDPKRLEACSYTVINSFYATFGSKLQNVHPLLMFNADETMVETKSRRKVLVPDNIRQAIEAGFPEMPHITGMMCANVFAAGPPPLIILEDRKTLPEELKDLVFSNKISVGSTSNGYMTRDMFLIWTILFINWLMSYRLTLPADIRESRAVLIIDGHLSRENPLACLLFRKAFVDVIVLPSHTTHVLQWFDVGLAAPLKRYFSSKFKKNLKESCNNPALTSNAAKYRDAAIRTFVDAWSATCTPSNCMAAAKATGMYPFNPNAVRDSVFVRNLTPEEQRRYDAREARNARRVTISNKLLTDAQLIIDLANQINAVPGRFSHLCNLQEAMQKSYRQIIQDVLSSPKNDSFLLSPMTPLIMPRAAPVYF